MNRYSAVLGLAENPTPEELRARYRELVKQWHPDRFCNRPKLRARAEQRLKLINEAYRMMKKPRPRPAAPAEDLVETQRFLESQVALVLLPPIVIVLAILYQRVLLAIVLLYPALVVLLMAWQRLARNVWRDRTLTAAGRFAWIVLMMLFGFLAVPVYFAGRQT